MKNIIACLILLFPICIQCQEVTVIEKQQLQHWSVAFKSFHPDFASYTYDSKQVNDKLYDALGYHQKSNNKTAAAVTTALAGAGLIAIGALHHVKPGLDGLFDFTKPAFFLLGTITVVTAVPFATTSGKYRRRWHNAMEEAHALLPKK